MCGFSARTVAALDALGASYAAVDILPDPRIRQELSAISNWPTIPQLFVNGELVGGCDIVTEMYETGELADDARVQPPADAPEEAPVAAEPGAPPLQIRNDLALAPPSRRAALSRAAAGLRRRRRERTRRRAPGVVAFAVVGAGRPGPRPQRRRAVPLGEHDQGDADGGRAARRRHAAAHRP